MLRVTEFGTAHAADFPATGFAGESFAELARVTGELRQFAVAKTSHQTTRRRQTTAKSSAREALLEDLRAINRSARAMARRIPGIDDKFRMPRKLNDQAFLTVALMFAADAEPLAEEFAKYELPANFLADLRADIAAFEKACADQSSAQNSATDANETIDDLIATGLDIVRDLDAVVKNRYRNDALTLSAWTRAAHVERPARAAVATATPVQA